MTNKLILCCCISCFVLAGCGIQKNSLNKEPRRIFLAGASTCASYDDARRPLYGWGEKLQEFLPGTIVLNYAKSGRSTKSFIDEGCWDAMMSEVRAGDIVIITFGHNDEKKKDPKRYSAPFEGYYDNLCRFVADVKGKGATPVLMSPVSRRRFMADNTVVRTHGKYPAASRKAAEDSGAAFVDLEQLSFEWLGKLGPEESKKCYLWTDEKQDNTHFQERGAREVAEIVAKALLDKKIL